MTYILPGYFAIGILATLWVTNLSVMREFFDEATVQLSCHMDEKKIQAILALTVFLMTILWPIFIVNILTWKDPDSD